MEQQQTRRQRREALQRQREQRAAGCLRIFVLVVVLLTGYLILALLDGAGQIRWTTTLEPNPYDASDFTARNGYLTCTAVYTRRGLDVSEHQEAIDWETVRAAGFDFAFIRIGYRGYTTGDIYEDDYARENLAGAKAAGLDVGVYFYAQATNAEEAAEEAKWCLDYLDGENLDLPVVYDWEYVGGDSRTANMDKATLTECVRTFCDAVEDGGYESMVYFNPHVGNDLLDLKQLQQYPWWLAQYKDAMDYPYKVDIWQYTEEGSVPGIKGDVDIDLMFIHE